MKYKQFKGGVKTAANVADRALSIALKTKKLLNVEYKFLPTIQSGSVVTAGTIIPLSLAAAGTGESGRVGVSIKGVSLRAIMKWAANSLNTAYTQLVRCIIFRDVSSDGSAPLVSDVLESSTILAFPNNANKDRFNIMMDKKFYLNNVSKTNEFDTFYAKTGSHITYSGTTGTIAQARKGHYFMLLIGEAAANTPTYDVQTKLIFIDN